jgi:hypothetical protein
VPHTKPLPPLTEQEQALYAALCTGEHGPSVRLEQEFVRFDLVIAALAQEPTVIAASEAAAETG